MGNKLKDFLFPAKGKDELDSTTIVVKKEEIKNKNGNPSIFNNASPNILTPKVFSQVESVANELLAGRSVIVDLTETEISEAKRICDFLNGITFALDGKVNKVAKLVYLFSPKKDK